MYGKWLYKEISTEYGACKVEIYRKNYTGVSIEIGALAADSLSIALENLGSITDPIGKSVCSFSIIDTDQVEYDDFFTPDATALKVVVSTRVGSGAYVTRWSGYVTPDFFAESLSYRTPISISARDNIGYLNDVDFDLTATTITVRELIQSAFKMIAEDYPMSLSFVTQKQTAEGILAIDATISTTLLREMSWGEALETILHDLGLQMRWVDNNTIAVLDLSQIPEYYAAQGFNFVDASGYREIVPAWRELSQEQNYGVRENFFEGWLREDNIAFVKTENIRIPLSMGGVTGLVPMRYYAPNNWGVAGNTFVINPKDYVYFGTYGQMAQPFGERIFFTGVEKDATNIANNYMSYRQDVYASNRPMRITFKAFTSVMATGGIGNNDALLAYDPANRFMDFATGDTLQLGLKVNLLLHVGTRTYILGQNWEEINGAETNSLYFVLPKIGQVDGSSVTPNEEEITIDVNTIPNDGVLELRIYGFTIHNKTNLQEDAGSATYDWLRMVSYINEVKYTYNIDNPDTGRYSQVEVNKQHNIKDTQSYTFGQIPVECGAVNAFAGGLFKADGNELIGFQRNANATNYNLLELVGRELIHFNKKNYNRLSGTIRNLNKEPLMFNRLFVREGKKYAPYNYSLNVISNEMNITSMQEVELYETATFNTIDSQITTGGGTVSGGNNTILQYSEEAGNEKRLYELQTATEQEKNDAYVLVDKAGFPEARKVHISELGGFDVSELEQYLESNGYATLKRIWEVDSVNAVVRTTYNVVSTQEVISGRRASGASSDVTGGGGISQVTAQMIVDALGYVPYSSQNPSGYITSSALNGYAKTSDIPSLSGYATQAWVEGKKYLTAIPSEYITETELSNTLGGYQTKITSSNKLAYSLISGTPSLATVATSGKYSDLSGVPTSLPASDVYTWAKAATKPTYTASEVGALSTGGGTIKSDSYSPLIIDTTNNQNRVQFKVGGVDKALVGWNPTYGAWLYNYPSSSYLHIKDDGTPCYNGNTLIHSGNYSSYALPLSGGTMQGVITMPINYQIQWGDSGKMIYGTNDRIKVYASSGLYINDNLAIHSGNIGDYALKTDGSNAMSANAYIKWNTGEGTENYSVYGNGFRMLTYNASTGDYRGGISIGTRYGWQLVRDGYTGTLQARFRVVDTTTWEAWKTIAFTDSNVASATQVMVNYSYNQDVNYPLLFSSRDNIGVAKNGSLYTDYYGKITYNPQKDVLTVGNVAGNASSATKLQTARTIWGQSFDGTGNVDGNITINPASGYYSRISAATNGMTIQSWQDGVGYLPIKLNPSAGNVLIGTTTDNGSGAKLQVSGNLTATGEVISTRRATSSDARLKDNINRLLAEDCLAMVRNLHPSSWDWKENGEHSMGFIAQDIEPLMPYAVTRIKDDKLGEKLNLQYDQFFAPVVGAIQCLDSEIEQLKKRVKYLENKLQEYGYNRY